MSSRPQKKREKAEHVPARWHRGMRLTSGDGGGNSTICSWKILHTIMNVTHCNFVIIDKYSLYSPSRAGAHETDYQFGVRIKLKLSCNFECVAVSRFILFRFFGFVSVKLTMNMNRAPISGCECQCSSGDSDSFQCFTSFNALLFICLTFSTQKQRN